jgi:hypothetical protein
MSKSKNMLEEFEEVFGRPPHHQYEVAEWLGYEMGEEKVVYEEKDAIAEAVNPKHYKLIPKEAYERFPEGLEYMDIMEYLLSHHKPYHAHCLGHVFKYAMRAGKKDLLIQDLKKAQWYLNRLISVIENESK